MIEATRLSNSPTPLFLKTHTSTLLKNTSSFISISISTTPSIYICLSSLAGRIEAIVPMTYYLFMSPLASLKLLLSTNQTQGNGEASRAVSIGVGLSTSKSRHGCRNLAWITNPEPSIQRKRSSEIKFKRIGSVSPVD